MRIIKMNAENYRNGNCWYFYEKYVRFNGMPKQLIDINGVYWSLHEDHQGA